MPIKLPEIEHQLALQEGAELQYATVDGMDLSEEDDSPTKVYATDDQGMRHEYVCTDFASLNYKDGQALAHIISRSLPLDLGVAHWPRRSFHRDFPRKLECRVRGRIQ